MISKKGFLYDYKRVLKLYSKVNGELIWNKDSSIYDKYRDIVEESFFYGLNPEKYRISLTEDVILNEILLTDRLLQLAYDSFFGRVNPKDVYETWNYPKKKDFIVEDLIQFSRDLDKNNFYSKFSPSYPQFHALSEKFRGYYNLIRNFNQRAIKIRKPLRIGDRHPDIPYIRELLYLLGDLESIDSLEKAEFDTELEAGIKNFQRRHGLKTDGILGKETVLELNYPLVERLIDIAINMEKFRWLPESLNPNRIEINIPSFSLEFYKEDKLQFRMRTIVGKKEGDDFRATFIYSGRVKEVEFYPFWYVPDKIKVKDLLPKIRKNASYLEKNNFIVIYGGKHISPYSLNWYTVDPQNLKLIQLPGEKNSLGKVKIVFENPFDIYLHDTPYKELFEKENRASSSGCIRLENAQLLTEALLEEEGYDQSRVDSLFSSKENRKIKLKSNFTVYTFYNTVLIKDRIIYFYKDIYGYDKILKSKLLKG
ncbi:MAG: L,D-transpeptidase family protein [Hydrogenothermaceae bacterium]|nr:L,D-transpeptidase family protein [Hydrogenothermaceae bacterium]